MTSAVDHRLAKIDEFTFLEQVPISDMFVAPYGRPVGVGQIGRMLKSGFDPRKLGIITLSMRADGRYAVIDGNHRRCIAQHYGLSDMLARVFIDLSYEEEAQLFSALNTVNPPTALDRWRARIEYNDPTALAIRDVLEDVGLRVGQTHKGMAPGVVLCVSQLDTVFTNRGPDELREILTILRGAWDLDPAAFSGRIVGGMATFWARYRDVADIKRLTQQLQQTTPHRLLAAAGVLASAIDQPTTAVGKQIAATYAGRSRKFSLPDWKPRLDQQTREDKDPLVVGRRIVKRPPNTRRVTKLRG